jgi:RNA polymerase sigma-70 factor (ECF subfamily)
MPDWSEILRRDGPAAWRTAYRLLGNRADADECFQDACLAALGVSRRQEVACWGALLQRLAAARAIDRLRSRRRREARERRAGRLEAAQGDSPGRDAESAELSGSLRAALGRLPARQAEVFCLGALEDWSHAEIARHLGTSPGAVAVLLHRARVRLRALLGRELKAAEAARGGDAS